MFSVSVASQAVKPNANHLLSSKGPKRTRVILSQALFAGAKNPISVSITFIRADKKFANRKLPVLFNVRNLKEDCGRVKAFRSAIDARSLPY